MFFKVHRSLVNICMPPYIQTSTFFARQNHQLKYTIPTSTIDACKFSFYPRSFCIWNQLPSTAVTTVTTSRAVASLTVPGGQEFHFHHFLPQIWIKLSYFLISFLMLALRVGKSPTREGPGYATDHISFQGYGLSSHQSAVSSTRLKMSFSNQAPVHARFLLSLFAVLFFICCHLGTSHQS